MPLEEYPIKSDLVVLVGYKDGHVGIVYNTGIPVIGRLTFRIEKDEIAHVERVLDAQERWVERVASYAGRPMPKPIVPTPLRISGNVAATVGHPDSHVEIVVATGFPWPAPRTVTIRLEQDAVPRAQYAIRKAVEWRDKSEVERFLHGAE